MELIYILKYCSSSWFVLSICGKEIGEGKAGFSGGGTLRKGYCCGILKH